MARARIGNQNAKGNRFRHSPEEIEKMRRFRHTDEAKERIRQAKLDKPTGIARKYTDEERVAYSKRMKEMWRCGQIKQSHGRRAHWSGIWFRSSWEVNVAKLLTANSVTWQYEPERFDLGDETYLPDFYLPEFDVWIEVKGHMTEDAERKVSKFRSTGRNLIIAKGKRQNYLRVVEKLITDMRDQWPSL